MLTLLPADISDAAVLFELNKSLIEQYEDLSSIDLPEVLAWVRRKIEKKLPEYRAVIVNGEKAGYFRLCESDENMLEIDDLYVLEAHQGKGVGGDIVRHCISESERLGKPLMLYVFTANTRAFRLYEKLGFQLSETVSSTRSILVRPLER